MARIYTRIVFDMTQDDIPVLEAESFEYCGPMSLCIGGSSSGRGSRDGRGDGPESSGRGGGRGRGSESSSGRGDRSGRSDNSGGGKSSGSGQGQSGGNSSPEGRTGGSGRSTSAQESVRERAAQNAQTSREAISKTSKKETGLSAEMAGRDMSKSLGNVMGTKVTKREDGYYDKRQNRVAYNSGMATSYGAHRAARANDLGASYAGSKAVDRATRADRAAHRVDRMKTAMADVSGRIAAMNAPPEVKARMTAALNSGQFAELAKAGLMSAPEETAVRNAVEGPVERLQRALGMPSKDVTTDLEAYSNAVASGAMSPNGTLTTRGIMGVAAPAAGLMAGPIGALAGNVAGPVGTVAANIGTKAANAYGASTANMGPVGSAISGIAGAMGFGPIGGAMALGSNIANLNRAQRYAGTQPSRVARHEYSADGGNSAPPMGVEASVLPDEEMTPPAAQGLGMPEYMRGSGQWQTAAGNPFSKYMTRRMG